MSPDALKYRSIMTPSECINRAEYIKRFEKNSSGAQTYALIAIAKLLAELVSRDE